MSKTQTIVSQVAPIIAPVVAQAAKSALKEGMKWVEKKSKQPPQPRNQQTRQAEMQRRERKEQKLYDKRTKQPGPESKARDEYIAMPAAIGNCILNSGHVFKSKPYNFQGLDGTEVSFSVLLTRARYLGTGTYDNYPALGLLDTDSVIDPDLAVGFINTAGTTVSGVLVHPDNLGSRMRRERHNWLKWRVKDIEFSFAPNQGTTAVGNVMLAISDDPNNLIEGSTEADGDPIVPSVGNMAQCVPSVMSSIYRSCSVRFKPKGQKWLRTSTSNKDNDSWTFGNYGDMGFEQGLASQRLVAMWTGDTGTQPQTLGTFWVRGVLQFCEPAESNISVGSTYTPNTFSVEGKSERPLGKRRNTLYCLKDNKWVAPVRRRPQISITIPPPPILSREVTTLPDSLTQVPVSGTRGESRNGKTTCTCSYASGCICIHRV